MCVVGKILDILYGCLHTKCSMVGIFCSIHHPVVQALQGIFLQQQNVNNETTNTISIRFSVNSSARFRSISFAHLIYVYPNTQSLSIESHTFPTMAKRGEKNRMRKESKRKSKPSNTTRKKKKNCDAENGTHTKMPTNTIEFSAKQLLNQF